MLTKPRYSLRDLLLWTRLELLAFIVFSAIVTALYRLLDLSFLHLPWAFIAVVGTAVAFIISFQNNAAYGRIWEARKIWGGIVNTSRTWAMKVKDMVGDDNAESPVGGEELLEIKKTLIHRHVAWLSALRHAMRQSKPWEEFALHRTNREWQEQLHIPEKIHSLEEELATYLSDDERERVLSKANKQTAILALQSEHLRKLKQRGLLWEFAFLELENVLEELFTLQGKSERIKNFPYPRQYATLSHLFARLFIVLIPFAAVPEFSKIGHTFASSWPLIADQFVWGAIPFCVLIMEHADAADAQARRQDHRRARLRRAAAAFLQPRSDQPAADEPAQQRHRGDREQRPRDGAHRAGG